LRKEWAGSRNQVFTSMSRLPPRGTLQPQKHTPWRLVLDFLNSRVEGIQSGDHPLLMQLMRRDGENEEEVYFPCSSRRIPGDRVVGNGCATVLCCTQASTQGGRHTKRQFRGCRGYMDWKFSPGEAVHGRRRHFESDASSAAPAFRRNWKWAVRGGLYRSVGQYLPLRRGLVS